LKKGGVIADGTEIKLWSVSETQDVEKGPNKCIEEVSQVANASLVAN
jgi:hypothetical protein